jgi:hypothetical protein
MTLVILLINASRDTVEQSAPYKAWAGKASDLRLCEDYAPEGTQLEGKLTCVAVPSRLFPPQYTTGKAKYIVPAVLANVM